MLTAKVLNSNASLNSFSSVSSIDFIMNDTVKVNFQLFDTDEQLRYVPPSSAVITLVFNKGNEATLEKVATPNVDDRSLVSVDFTTDDTKELVGGNVIIKLDIKGDGSEIRTGVIQNAMRKVVTGAR